MEGDMLVVKDKDLAEKFRALILDKHRSDPAPKRVTKTSMNRPSSALLGKAVSKEELKYKDSSHAAGGTSRSGQCRKAEPEYFDLVGSQGSVSQTLKDLFTKQNHKLVAQYPEDFKIYVDCTQFKSSEIKVNAEGGFLVVHAKHDHKLDEHGLVKREFTRRFRIPEDVKQERFKCTLNQHQILIIEAPRKPISISIPVTIGPKKN